MARSKPKSNASSHAPPIEWAAAIISTVLVVAMLAYTLYQGVSNGSRPPLIAVQADSVIETPGGYLVMFSATNSGDETAAAVQISGELMRDTVAVEKSAATIDYVPSQAVRKGGIMFSNDPRTYRLELRATGFSRP
ncbi:MAG TPA: TIGR02588 family protein [Longimicrobiales bacterium]|nr:TIGR02588 family protein [Longimicrobiales bacterium]